MSAGTPREGPTFDEVCRIVGRLYLDLQLQLERVAGSTPVVQSLQAQLVAEQKRTASLTSHVNDLMEQVRQLQAQLQTQVQE